MELLQNYESLVGFSSPQRCFEDAEIYLPAIALRRGFDPSNGIDALDRVKEYVAAVETEAYELHEQSARHRIRSRDESDWPVVATALLLDRPIWTEDHDFFGSGIATWTTATVEHYLRNA